MVEFAAELGLKKLADGSIRTGATIHEPACDPKQFLWMVRHVFHDRVEESRCVFDCQVLTQEIEPFDIGGLG